MWQELQAVKTEISELEEEKRRISDIVRALVVRNSYYSSKHYNQNELQFLSRSALRFLLLSESRFL